MLFAACAPSVLPGRAEPAARGSVESAGDGSAGPVAPAVAALAVQASVDAAGRTGVELGSAEWRRNGSAAEPARHADGVELDFDQQGIRWAVIFETGAEGMVRLGLDWDPGPDGLLFEVVLDGRRLSPSRDGWRPAPKRLTTDLGPAWLGAGRHLLEFVSREQTRGAFGLRRLAWTPPVDR